MWILFIKKKLMYKYEEETKYDWSESAVEDTHIVVLT